MSTCRYCGRPLRKILIGWAHTDLYVSNLHWPRPQRGWDR